MSTIHSWGREKGSTSRTLSPLPSAVPHTEAQARSERIPRGAQRTVSQH
jgi:hypothetical protein